MKINIVSTSSFSLKPYTPLQLCVMYQVSKKTFMKWLVPFGLDIGERTGHFYSIKQVQVIIDKIGFPGTLIAE